MYNAWTITKNSEAIISSDWKIDQIEALPEAQAQELAEDHTNIKGYDVYFITFEKYFGYSALAYYQGHIIRFAAEYELHYNHMNKSKEELKEAYIAAMNNKFFTDQELAEPLRNYHDYRSRVKYLVDYYGDRENHVSFFHIIRNNEARKALDEAKKDLHMNWVCHGFYESKDFVTKCEELAQAIETAQREKLKEYDYLKAAFKYEFGNYECHIGGRFTEAAEAVIGKPFSIEDTETTEVQRRAYKDAKREYLKYCEDHDLF